MPAKSQAQARFMGAIAGGAIQKKGLSPDKAKEFVRGQKIKDLPAVSPKATPAYVRKKV